MAWGYFRAGVLSGGIVLTAITHFLIVGCLGSPVRAPTITCDRPETRIEAVERGLFGAKREAHVLRRIRGASTQTRIIKRRGPEIDRRRHLRILPEPRVHRAALVDVNGNRIPLGSIFGSATAAALNSWIGAEMRPVGTAKTG